MSAPSLARPTHIRFAILALATSVALLLYLDRYCLSTSDLEIKKELSLTDDQMAWIRSAFFFTYALGQIPMGWLSDRLGVRSDPPRLGQHTEQLLQGLGYDSGQIQALLEAKSVA